MTDGPGAEEAAPAGTPWQRTLRSLRHRDYRLFLTGHAVSVMGTWMQRVAQDWLVLQLTGSGIALGVAAALQFGPTLVFGLWGGSLTDRADRRRLVIATQAASMVLAAALAVVTLLGVVTLAEVYALTLGLGLVTVVDSPARQALLTEKVPREDYVNAQALNSTVHNLGRLVGPAIAGVLIATVGVGISFAVNALSFVAVLWGLLLMSPTARTASISSAGGTGTIREGLTYVRRRPELGACLAVLAVISLLGQNFRVVLPLLAQKDLHSGASGYGSLTAALGLGAVIGALLAANRLGATLRAVLVAAAAFGVTNLLVAAAPTMLLALAAMVTLGIANISVNTLTRTMLQLETESRMQGRVIALHGLIFLGSTPFGGPLLGWWCTVFGARAGLVLAGVSALAATAAVFVVARRRGLELQRTPRASGLVRDPGEQVLPEGVDVEAGPEVGQLGQVVFRDGAEPLPSGPDLQHDACE